ncbi:uncharacterized protein LOC132202606 [Neocloeon triangulifer]|uniref:uncharacterized protein LOC132202606 n=1 Tax=Neocloeon triangulifer TaxID=2078957 RepID=UPI00286EFA9E|nr:uncharacterized protein LOC132202606 [Neocloeon triangulifer]
MYYRNSTKQVKCVLDDYVKNGTVTLFQWQKSLPFTNNVDLREENMFAALNDCVLRSINVHKYVAPFDVDEFIVTKYTTILQFLEAFDKRGGNEISFVFRNAFFYLPWPDDPNYSGLDLTTQKKTKRITEFTPMKRRAKYICKPEGVAEIGNHYLWEMTKKNYSEIVIKTELGHLFHYRNCEHDNCFEDKFIEDRTMWKYQEELEKRTKTVEQNFVEKCQLDPLRNI